MPLDKELLREQLPRVGDVLRRVPSYLIRENQQRPEPRRCRVIEVNREHLWYLVQYDQDGLFECFYVEEGE